MCGIALRPIASYTACLLIPRRSAYCFTVSSIIFMCHVYLLLLYHLACRKSNFCLLVTFTSSTTAR
uniref:Uncharacterized protein n=1 Tax=uncultured marine virus TaxID=186617 RepID=A0A0F7L632_9VIRU|nr:hypothetical protein [uncultured marine virus]